MASRMSKKTRLIIMVTLIIAVGAIVAIALSRSPSSPSDSLPTFPEAETVLSELEGTPVVLNFWSISCYWCRKQLPYLENVAQQSGGEIKVIAVNIVDNAATVQNFFVDYEPTMIVALDSDRSVFVDYCLAYNNTRGAIPFTFFVDGEGIVQYIKLGAFASETELWEQLSSVLGIIAP